MRRLIFLISLAGAIVGCRRPADGPEGAAQTFIRLVRAGDCEQAWEHMTAASQLHYAELHRSFVEHSPYPDREPPASQLACSPYADYLPGTVTERSRSGDTAMVGVVSRTGTLFPIIPFLTDRRKDTPVTMQVVRESGRWKVSLLYSEAAEARRAAVERGERARAEARERSR